VQESKFLLLKELFQFFGSLDKELFQFFGSLDPPLSADFWAIMIFHEEG
jgi:hypothetical protein